MPVGLLGRALRFPDPLAGTDGGLLAVGGDLSVERLLLAYRSGIFPWYSEGQPILWWSPDPRCVIVPAELHVSRSLAKVLRQGRFCFTVDRAFERVIRACARTPRPRQRGTWLTRDMLAAYLRLHRAGHAHSVEAWAGDELAGGLYGVLIGRIFFGESMFSLRPDASKSCLAVLARWLHAQGCPLIDSQVASPHILSLGARELPLVEFLAITSRAVALPALALPAELAWDAGG